MPILKTPHLSEGPRHDRSAERPCLFGRPPWLGSTATSRDASGRERSVATLSTDTEGGADHRVAGGGFCGPTGDCRSNRARQVRRSRDLNSDDHFNDGCRHNATCSCSDYSRRACGPSHDSSQTEHDGRPNKRLRSRPPQLLHPRRLRSRPPQLLHPRRFRSRPRRWPRPRRPRPLRCPTRSGTVSRQLKMMSRGFRAIRYTSRIPPMLRALVGSKSLIGTGRSAARTFRPGRRWARIRALRLRP